MVPYATAGSSSIGESTCDSKSRNPTFTVLQAILILMVIDDHLSSRIGLLSSIFPYDSFFMPAFVFISGYFYKDRPVHETVRKRLFTLFLPYLAWCYLMNLLMLVLHRLDIVHWYSVPTINNTLAQLYYAPMTEIANPGWFAVMLFWLILFYSVVKTALDKIAQRAGEWIVLAALFCLCLLSPWLCMNGAATTPIMTALLRIWFYAFFFHLGYMFHKHWEQYMPKPGLVIVLSIAVNVILICLFDEKIRFISTAWMSDFHSWYLPMITSITGTLFWYEVAKLIAERIGVVRGIVFLAENTFTIMMTHLFFTRIPLIIAIFGARNGWSAFAGLDFSRYLFSPWHLVGSRLRFSGFFCGLLGSLAVCYVIQIAKAVTRQLFDRTAST